MNEMFELKDIIGAISGLDEQAMKEARLRQDYLAKVPGSLGKLEDISIRIAGITGNPWGNEVGNQAIIIMCADNGVVEEGVASAPQSVTLMQTINFTKGITGVSSQAKYFGIDMLTVDMGVRFQISEQFSTESMFAMNDDNPDDGERLADKVINRRIADGTKNFAKEPAMSRDEAIRGIMIGIEAVEACKEAGKKLVGVGEMGIGNTTTASAIIAAMILYDGVDRIEEDGVEKTEKENIEKIVERIVGRGGGLSNEGLEKKRQVICDAIKKYEPLFVTEEGLDIVELLRCVGGFDIAGMVGAYLGAALYRIPVVVDGIISIAAAVLAVKICPKAKDFIFTSHRSKEEGYAFATELLGIEPMYDLGMRLGEGSGCPIAFKIIEAACAAMNGMKSLDEAEVDAEYLDEFREDGQFL